MGNITSAIRSEAMSTASSSCPVPQSAAVRKVADILALTGIRINGDRPWDLRGRDDRFYQRALSYGTLGVGEAHMDGWWDAEALDEFRERVVAADLRSKVAVRTIQRLALKGRVLNGQSVSRSKKVALLHYDIGNDVYEAMLDRRMQYTCAYWKEAENLDQARENKLDLICRKFGVSPGMSVLEWSWAAVRRACPLHGGKVRLPGGQL